MTAMAPNRTILDGVVVGMLLEVAMLGVSLP
jgi:hypothetical protein